MWKVTLQRFSRGASSNIIEKVVAFTCNKNQNYKQKPKAKQMKRHNKLQKQSFVDALETQWGLNNK